MKSTGQQADYNKLKKNLANREWRLNNLYYIKDKQGERVKFRLNWAQNKLFKNLHYYNVILKARQLGFTTLAMIYFLDACLFNSNHSAGVIAHTQKDANDLFKNKIKFAYDNLPDMIKNERQSTSDNARMLEFSNGSQIYTGTSLRSGTLQKLLISEYGKISAKTPEKAKEIKTGALNTVEAGQQIFVESTAEGKVGEFYKLCERARKLADAGKKLARLEPKMFFFPWFDNPLYVATDDEVDNYVLSEELVLYFARLSEDGITLTDEQKVWYAIKSDQQGEDMSQEYPTTPEEAFQGSLEGAYYTKQMKKVRERGQITNVPYDARYPVYTWWDLGTRDLMTIVFYQHINGKHCIIDYYENGDEGWAHYATMLNDKGYNYAKHFFPHDGAIRNRDSSGELVTDKDAAMASGIRPIQVVIRTKNTHQEIINTCQPILATCFLDEVRCHKLIDHLDAYRRKWCKATGMFLKEPLHDEASHGCDAFRTFAANADLIHEDEAPTRPSRVSSSGGWMG